MKRYPNQAGPSVGLWALVIVSVALIYALLFGGCATSPKQAALKTLTTVVKEVDIAANAWTVWVVDQEEALKARNESTADLLRKQGRVNALDSQYRAVAEPAIRLAILTYNTTDVPATADVVNAATALIKAIDTQR